LDDIHEIKACLNKWDNRGRLIKTHIPHFNFYEKQFIAEINVRSIFATFAISKTRSNEHEEILVFADL
jgi:hypothetical protein